MLPVNCNRMMTAGACPFELSLSTNWRGTRYGGGPTWGLQAFFKGLLSPTGVVCFSKLSPITLQPKKKKSLNGWFSIQLSLCWASQRFFHWTLCPVILNVIYALYATWTCVSVCMCVCVYFSLPHVFLASGLALSPSPWLACCPCNLMACSALEWESRRAALLVTSCLRAFFYIFPFFFLCGWRSLLIVSLELIHFGFQRCLTADEKWTSSSPRVFRGNVFRQRECFLWKKRGCSIALYSSSAGTKLDFLFPQTFLCSSIAFFVFFFFPSSVRYLHP